MTSPLQPQAKGSGISAHFPMGFVEFVAMIAGLMALNALAMDIMLPALPDIGSSLGVLRDNDRQAVLSVYMIGFGLGQFMIGSISDRFGRRTVLLSGLFVYIVTAGLCASAPSFELLLFARFAQGVASSVPRVITTSVVRDCYEGRRMASVMSLAMTVFMAVPVLAPSIGQLIVLAASWRFIFWFLTAYGIVITAWVVLRLPETLARERRRSISPRSVLNAFGQVLSDRYTVGYSLAGGLMFGAMFSFLLSAQQVFIDIFHLGRLFPLAFAAVALSISLSSFLNARLVGRLGMRRISHGAIVVFATLSLVSATLARLGLLSLAPFMVLLGGVMFLIGMIFSNFNAIAMEGQGKIAGTASSLIGSATTIIATAIGYTVGQMFDGTLVPLTTAHLTLSLLCLVTIGITEKGRYFRA